MTVKNHSKICLCVSCLIMVIALIMTITGNGINLGIDFAGGLSMQYNLNGDGTAAKDAAEGATAVTFDQTTALADTKAVLSELNVGSFTVTAQGTSEVYIRVKDVAEESIQGLQLSFEQKMTEKGYLNLQQTGDVSYVGPVAGQTLVSNAIWSVVIAAALMLIYIAIRFDVNSGLAAVFGLMHDVLIMLSFMVLLRSIIEMNSSFIAAMLTIVGYSINNTIVIFDRIRENVKKAPNEDRVTLVNTSIKECLGRTINTTLTTLITIVALYVLGVDSIKEFALPIIIGIISGVYSANMINGYVWAFLENKKLARKAAKK